MSQEHPRQRSPRTLTPYLSSRNFQISVAARLNADKTQTNETIYNPDQPCRTLSARDQGTAELRKTPLASRPRASRPIFRRRTSGGGDIKAIKRRRREKREELTNYEVSSKSDHRPSAPGLRSTTLSVAVLINTRRRSPPPSATSHRPSAAERAGRTRSSNSSPRPPGSIDSGATRSKSPWSICVDSSHDLDPAPGPSLVEIFAHQAGSIANAGAIVAVAAMVVWFGVRPGLKMALALPRLPATGDAPGACRRPNACVGAAGRRRAADREHPHRDRFRPRRIFAGAAGAARQRT